MTWQLKFSKTSMPLTDSYRNFQGGIVSETKYFDLETILQLKLCMVSVIGHVTFNRRSLLRHNMQSTCQLPPPSPDMTYRDMS